MHGCSEHVDAIYCIIKNIYVQRGKQPDHSSRESHHKKKKPSRISDSWRCAQITEPCLGSISQQEIRDFLNYSIAECEKKKIIFLFFILKIFFLLNILCCYYLITKIKIKWRRKLGLKCIFLIWRQIIISLFVNRVGCTQGSLYVLCVSLEPLTLQPLRWQSCPQL